MNRLEAAPLVYLPSLRVAGTWAAALATRVPHQRPTTMPQESLMRVECKECRFGRIIRPEDEELPGAVVIRHGEETGHKLDVAKLEEQGDPLTP